MKLLYNQQLFFVPANPTKGFNFGYFIKIHCNNTKKKLQLIGECNNTLVVDDVEENLKRCEKEIKYNGLVARQLQETLDNSAWIFPCFIRPHHKKYCNIYTHSLCSIAINTKRKDIERVDKQFLCMIKDAKKQLNNKQYLTTNKIIMVGFSASAKFAQRWTLLYPEHVQAVIAAGMGAILCLPIAQYDNMKLNFPLGVNDYEKLTGHVFNKKTYYKIPHYMFLGDRDYNDPVPYKDCYTDKERQIIYQIFGKDMQKERWPQNIEWINRLKLSNQHLYLLEGIDHAPHNIFKKLKEENIDFKKYKKL